jgi:hypothetical protein
MWFKRLLQRSLSALGRPRVREAEMLDASALRATTDNNTKSFLIKDLLEEIDRYNVMPQGMNLQQKADHLLVVCKLAALYCTSKPPQNKPDKPGGGKTFRRWEAVDVLLGQIRAEVQSLGLRMLYTPNNFREIGQAIGRDIKRSYWLELIDPLHAAGQDLAARYAEWLTNAQAIEIRTSFWDYLGRPQDLAHGADYIVKYYPEIGDDGRGQLHFSNGRLYDEDDDIWSTTHLETHWARDGWGIFVVSPDGRIYGGSHVVGEHHHSSFLAGGMVSAAGEMVVDPTGVVRFITAKSGHYMPTVDNMRQFVLQFIDIPADALIQPNLRQPVVHRVGDFRVSTQAQPAPSLSREEVELWLRQRCRPATFPDLADVASVPGWRPAPAPRGP